MISREERQYLYWLSSRCWSGSGHIVEIGPWLGGSTFCLAAGLRQNRREDRWKIHVYDSFVWQRYMADRHPLPISVGESFEPVFMENLKDYIDLLCVHNAWFPDETVQGDSIAEAIRDSIPHGKQSITWTDNEPIEILFVDGAKSWTGMRQMLSVFCSSLIPGKTILVLQDYKYWGAYWVASIAEFFSNHIEIVHHLRNNTIAFTLTKPLTIDDVNRLPTYENLDPGHCASLIDGAAEMLNSHGDREGAAIVRLGKVRMWVHKESSQSAREAFQSAERHWPLTASVGNLTLCRSWLEEGTKQSLPVPLKIRIGQKILQMINFVRTIRGRLFGRIR